MTSSWLYLPPLQNYELQRCVCVDACTIHSIMLYYFTVRGQTHLAHFGFLSTVSNLQTPPLLPTQLLAASGRWCHGHPHQQYRLQETRNLIWRFEQIVLGGERREENLGDGCIHQYDVILSQCAVQFFFQISTPHHLFALVL